jgi:hypothetical protein
LTTIKRRLCDSGIARLFYDLHSDVIRYVVEVKTWFAYDGRQWVKTTERSGRWNYARISRRGSVSMLSVIMPMMTSL